MFPRGARFPPPQVSDVPGPNSYNLAQDSQLTAYKRGAFLEKADRFSKDTPSDTPAPGDYDVPTTDSRPTSRPPQSHGDRYAALQRKVEDLERIHTDGKKAHQAEVDRLKLELSRAQKANAEHTDRTEKLKKQNATLEARIQDLKRASLTEQSELKDLRVKLKMSEHERTQLSSKQGEAGELKKALQAAESRRRDETREKDRAIADLEKSVSAERRKREMAEARLQELQGKGDLELQAAHTRCQSLQDQLTQSQEETQRLTQRLTAADSDADAKQHLLLEQLQQYRTLLTTAAEEYARLATNTVPSTTHHALKHQHGVLQLRAWRLERRLANSQDQITELAELIRRAHDANALLARQVHDLEEECEFYARSALDRPQGPRPPDTLHEDLLLAMQDLHAMELSVSRSNEVLSTSLAELYRLSCNALTGAYTSSTAELEQQQRAVQDQLVELSNSRSDLEAAKAALVAVQNERDDISKALSASARTLVETKTSATASEQRASQLEQEVRSIVQRTQTDKKTIQHLTETVKMSRMAEDGLRVEIDTLTAELAESEQFQAAYYSLSDEVKALIARKELAEDEAEQLSKFNAEILSHQNPAQKIMYVDRVRRELAETKHKLALTVVDLESATLHNADLLRELEMYKSVPLEDKPRTMVTRITRPPLSALNQVTPPAATTSTKGSPPATTGGGAENTNISESFEDFSYAI